MTQFAISERPIYRPTWATVDLTALTHNYSVLKQILGERVDIIAMVKADAYGHGAVPVSRVLEQLGVRALGVATVEEGMELRDAGIKVQVLVVGGLMGAGSPASKKMLDANLTPVVHSIGVLDSLEADAQRAQKRIGVHLKIDTGMSRMGVRPESLRALLSHIKGCPQLYVEGVMTHLADGENDHVSAQQMGVFLECKRKVEEQLGRIRVWHIANSAACLLGKHVDIPDADEVWARPGLALYGDMDGHDFRGIELKPVMALKSHTILLKHVPAGTPVSYGGTYTTMRPSHLALVPMGYADGYPWGLSGKAHVLVRGRRAPVLGRITMDMIIIDVTDIPDITVNDEVVLLGEQGSHRIELAMLASWAGTITYEILCGISKRMPRIYKPVAGDWSLVASKTNTSDQQLATEVSSD